MKGMLHIVPMNKAFSDEARKAALEARRAKAKSKPESRSMASGPPVKVERYSGSKSGPKQHAELAEVEGLTHVKSKVTWENPEEPFVRSVYRSKDGLVNVESGPSGYVRVSTTVDREWNGMTVRGAVNTQGEGKESILAAVARHLKALREEKSRS